MDNREQDMQAPGTLDIASSDVVIGWGETEIHIPMNAAFAAYCMVQKIGYDDALEVMAFYRKLSLTLKKDVYPHDTDDTRRNQALNDIMQLFAIGAPKRAKEREDLVIGFLYSLLRRNSTGRPSISWEKAAEYATTLLNPATRFHPDAWRKRTERWLRRKERAGVKLDKVGQRRRG